MDAPPIASSGVVLRVHLIKRPSSRYYSNDDREPKAIPIIEDKLRAPPNWQIWIARQTGILWRISYQRRAFTLGYLDGEGIAQSPDGTLAKNTHAITLGIGQLLINVVSSRVPELKFSFRDTTLGRKMHRIHAYERDIQWPPAELLNGAQADQVAAAFDRYTDTLKWRSRP